jgi:hypothetical protein
MSIAGCVAWAIASIGGSAQPSTPGQEFSADIVRHDPAGGVIGAPGRLYVSNRKVRIETPEAPAGFFLVEGDAGPALFVRATQHVFMDARQSTRLTRIFIPVDANDPCRQWQIAATQAGVPGSERDWHCERGGPAEYRIASPPRESSQVWIDPQLAFPVKLRAADGSTTALEHIQLAAQPANLFAVPTDYRKSDPQALIERMQHSDVWVQEPRKDP